MCGIAGFIHKGALNTAPFDQFVCTALANRGPDHIGRIALNEFLKPISLSDFLSSKAMLWHRRLSIIAVGEEGNQPFTDGNGRWMVYNGELYNYIELRSELEKEGIYFNTQTDSEVVLKAYAHWGISAFDRFIGMFAIVITDEQMSELIMVRDGLGIKPLYFFENSDAIIFSSRASLTAQMAGVYRIDLTVVYNFLKSGISDNNEHSFYDGISSLIPGEVRIYNTRNLELKQSALINYKRQQSPDPRLLNREERVEALRQLLLKTIDFHTRTDVGFCATLSGGLDSTAIIGMLKEKGFDNLNLYSYIPDNPSISEEKWIDIACNFFGITTHKIGFQEIDFWKDLDVFIEEMDMPFNSSSMYSQYKIYENVKRSGNTVVLDGQGGDEMFGGYIQYLYYRAYEEAARLNLTKAFKIYRSGVLQTSPVFMRTNLMRLALYNLAHPIYRLLKRTQKNSLLDYSFFKNCSLIDNYDASSLKGKIHIDRAYQDLPRLLRYADRNSMRWSLESRVPFASQELHAFVTDLPSWDLVSDEGICKSIYRDAVAPFLPNQILNRKDKKGFNTDDSALLYSQNAHSLMGDLDYTSFPFLNKEFFLGELSNPTGFDQKQLWRVFSLALWMHQNKLSA